MFEPGEVVVCVDGSFPEGIHDIYNSLPREGATYTVRDVVPGINWDLSNTCTVYLAELVNLPNEKGTEPGFAPHRFRRPDELEDTVSDFAEEPVEHRDYVPAEPAWKGEP